MCEKLVSPLIDSYIPAKEHKATTSNACKNMKGLSTGNGVTASCWTCDNGKKPFKKGTNNFVCGSTKSCPATMKLHQRSDGCYDVKKLKSYIYCPSPGVEKNGKCVYTVAAVKTNAHVLTAWAISKDKMKLHINPNANVKSIDSCVFEKSTSSEKIYSCPIYDVYIVRLNDGSTTEINMKEAINQYQANEEAANTPDSTDTTTGGSSTTGGGSSSTQAKTYKITYHPNGAKGNDWSETATYGQNYKTYDNWYKRTGHTFKGWNESPYGDGVDWTAWINKDWTWTYDKNVELYAQWEKNKYKISYDSNGGDGEMNDTIVNYGEETTLTNNAYTKTGYRFSSWNTKADGSGTTYTNGQSIKNLTNKDDETITLYAQWLVNSYTIKYNSNGGNGSMSNTMATYDKNVTLRDNKFTKSGFYFAGWNTAADGSGNSYSNGETVKNLSAENNGYVTLYAQWSSNGYTIIYNSNGGEGTMPKTIAEYGETITLSDNEFTRVGYKFKNWNTKADGKGTSYSNLQSVTNLVSTNNGSITLYAIWEANSYMISFHANGGEGNMSNLTASYGKSVTLPKNTYTRENYVFASWNTNADGTGTSYTNGQTVLNLTDEDDETVVLYAQWREKTEADDTYEITYAVDNDNMVLDDIPLRTTLSDYKNHFELGDSYTMEIDLGNKNYIYTGSKVKIYKNGTLEAEYTNVVRGDVNGDTKISALDYVKVKNHIMGSERITNTAYSLAADYNHDNKISALDYVGIKNYIMNGAG